MRNDIQTAIEKRRTQLQDEQDGTGRCGEVELHTLNRNRGDEQKQLQSSEEQSSEEMPTLPQERISKTEGIYKEGFKGIKRTQKLF